MADEKAARCFILSWRSAVLNSNLSSTAKFCHLALAEWADAEGGSCFPSIASLSAITGLNERTVRRAMAGSTFFIRSERAKKGQAWKQLLYELVLPEGADTTPARSRKGPGTESGAQAKTSGHSVQKVRTLTTKGPGTESDEQALDLASKQSKEKSLPTSALTSFSRPSFDGLKEQQQKRSPEEIELETRETWRNAYRKAKDRGDVFLMQHIEQSEGWERIADLIDIAH